MFTRHYLIHVSVATVAIILEGKSLSEEWLTSGKLLRNGAKPLLSVYCPLPQWQLFKGVAERGQWTRMMEDAERSYEAGDLDSALMVYLLMAEMGLEVAQTNAAYILEQGVCLYLGQTYSKCSGVICVVSRNRTALKRD